MQIEQTAKRFIVTHENELELSTLEILLNGLSLFFTEHNTKIERQHLKNLAQAFDSAALHSECQKIDLESSQAL